MSLLYLTREDVAGLLPSISDQLDLVEETYRAVGAGRVELPPKPGIHPRPDSFIHAMPAYLRDDDVAALKWVAGYPANKERGLPYITGLIVLNDPEIGVQPHVFRVSDDAGDREPPAVVGEAEALADGVGAGPVAARRGPIHESHRGGRGRVRGSDVATGEQRNAQGAQIPRGQETDAGHLRLRGPFQHNFVLILLLLNGASVIAPAAITPGTFDTCSRTCRKNAACLPVSG